MWCNENGCEKEGEKGKILLWNQGQLEMPKKETTLCMALM